MNRKSYRAETLDLGISDVAYQAYGFGLHAPQILRQGHVVKISQDT